MHTAQRCIKAAYQLYAAAGVIITFNRAADPLNEGPAYTSLQTDPASEAQHDHVPLEQCRLDPEPTKLLADYQEPDSIQHEKQEWLARDEHSPAIKAGSCGAPLSIQ